MYFFMNFNKSACSAAGVPQIKNSVLEFYLSVESRNALI